MVYYSLLTNVLQYFNRNDLDTLLISSRLFRRIVEQEFPTHPIRLFDGLVIRTNNYNNLTALLYNGNARCLPGRYCAEEFKKGTAVDPVLMREIFSRLNDMTLFLGQTVRFKQTLIYLTHDARLSQHHITTMEAISHVWSGQSLWIDASYNKCDVSQNCRQLFNSSAIIQPGGDVRLYGFNLPFSQFPNVYALKVLTLASADIQISPTNLLDFADGMAKYNSRTTVVLSLHGNFLTYIGKIRRAFSATLTPVPFKIIFVRSAYDEIFEFLDKNAITNEVLEMCAVAGEARNRLLRTLKCCSLCHFYALERRQD
ncbi:hypothetical protein DdX_04887 [Ditylenchus destructor]|uniref:Uncharacterized protein n=1 Tax=Ditylenchus destructor TaxID=166010 RepID=A0AAD4ND88_9BILA|nr:hypothetical protein DdX_04887 [Ditylenchus destructor]